MISAVRRFGCRPIGVRPARRATSSPQAPAAGRLVAGLVAGAVAEDLLPVVPLVDPNRFVQVAA